MSFNKGTTLFSEVRSFFKENQGTSSMYAPLRCDREITFILQKSLLMLFPAETELEERFKPPPSVPACP